MGRGILLRISFIMILIITLSGCRQQARPEEKEEVSVEVIVAELKEIEEVVTLRGQLKPKEEIMVIAKTPGLKVTEIAVQIGDEVEEGRFLFELDKTLARKQVEQAKMNYDLARGNYTQQRQLQQNIPILQEEIPVFQNMRIPAQYQEILNQSMEQQAEQRQSLETTKAAASAQLDQARIAYSSSLEQIGELEYFAPISGVVSQVNIQKNQMALNNGPAIVISNIKELKVTLSVSASLLKSLERGQQVKVRQGEEELIGVVDVLNPVTDVRSNLHTVEIIIDNSQRKITTGAFVHVDLQRDRRENVVVIPKATLVSEGNEVFVFLEEKGRALKRKVELGIDAGHEVEVIKGLKEGDKIIVKGQHFIEDGESVKVRGASSENN